MEEVTFLPCGLQSGVSNPCQGAPQENVAKEIIPAAASWCWIERKRWVIWAWNRISDLWTLRWFYLFYLRWVESNRCRIKIDNGIYSMWNQIWMISTYNFQVFFFVFFILRTCTDGYLLSDEFHEVWMFVLLPIAVWGLWHSQIFLFGSLATHDDLLECKWFKYVKSTPTNLKEVGNSDWSLLRHSRIISESVILLLVNVSAFEL